MPFLILENRPFIDNWNSPYTVCSVASTAKGNILYIIFSRLKWEKAQQKHEYVRISNMKVTWQEDGLFFSLHVRPHSNIWDLRINVAWQSGIYEHECAISHLTAARLQLLFQFAGYTKITRKKKMNGCRISFDAARSLPIHHSMNGRERFDMLLYSDPYFCYIFSIHPYNSRMYIYIFVNIFLRLTGRMSVQILDLAWCQVGMTVTLEMYAYSLSIYFNNIAFSFYICGWSAWILLQ